MEIQPNSNNLHLLLPSLGCLLHSLRGAHPKSYSWTVLGTAGLCLANFSLLIHTFPAKSTPEASRTDNQ